MQPKGRRVERAESLLEETLSGYPSGLPSIALVDRLQSIGIPEGEGVAVLERLRADGRLEVVRGHYRLADE